jgi:cellulose synthase/poly-beta-1,6-N-acetylglucosamine synthase-like glycosyltransferase
MLIRKEVFERVLPLPACLAEDSFILFKTLELGYQAKFCTNAYVTTERTHSSKEEVFYKNRTTLGIYQALNYAKPSPVTRVFYLILPLLAPMLCLAGKDGRSWAKGINRGFTDYLTKKRSTKF